VRIGELLDRDASLYPDEVAVHVVGDRQLTFSELQLTCRRLAGYLRSRRVRPDDRVLLVADNGLLPFEIHLACAYAGVAVVPLSTRLTASEMAFIVADCKPAMAFADIENAEVIGSVLGAFTPLLIEGSAEYARARTLSDPLTEDAAVSESIALIMYTSGTTGTPKGVCLSHRALTTNAFTLAVSQGLRHRDVFLSMTPLYHAAVGTRIVSMLVDGVAHVVMRGFDSGEALEVISRHRVTTTLVVPTQLRRILDDPSLSGSDLSSLRLLVYGAAPSSQELIRRAISDLSCGLYQGYGLTEAVTNLTGLLPHHHESADAARLRSAGQPVPGVALEIRNEGGERLGPDETGEIFVRTDKVMSGYWGNPDASAHALQDGWLRTGDIGVIDRAGFLTVVDRAKDMLISGGVNVYPSEIERVILPFPDVKDVAVVGRPDEEWGETPVAFVQASTPIDFAALERHCQRHLAGLKVPKSFYLVEDLPRTPTGKIRKAELRLRLVDQGDPGRGSSGAPT
jgi:O-succinylbenzoate-CoA ligase